jgi:hypothetical protein
MIDDRSPLKHSVHKVCVPNLHIAHFRKAQDQANPTVRRIFRLASRYFLPSWGLGFAIAGIFSIIFIIMDRVTVAGRIARMI